MSNYHYHRSGKQRPEYQGPKEAAILRSSKDGWVNVSAPYFHDITPRMIEDFKTYIDSSSRAWNPTTKFWEFKENCLGIVITILKKYFGDNITQNLTEQKQEQAPANLFQPVFEALKSLSDKSIMDKVYRALSMAVHPDVGGSNDLMTKLNNAYQEAKK